ncbi:MAG: glycosyltransferase family 9 protein [Chloroflexi bacterium]|nr:MAG: glycosyltransferase family 9 protein [Chloroflexota bacterium]
MSNAFTPGLLARLPESPRKVVVLRASRIGDFLCTIPALRALRAALPEAEITMITLPLLRDLVERSPYLDHYVTFPGFPGIAEQFFDAHRVVQFFQEMQAERFDLALQMQGSGVYSNPFMLLLGAKVTVGFVREGDAAGRLDAALPLPQRGHEIQRMLALTTFLGVPVPGETTEFPLWLEDHEQADALLANACRPLVGLHMSARDATRRWSLPRFAAVGRELLLRKGGTLVLLGEAGEWPEVDRVAREIGQACLNLAGKTSLPVLGGVIARLSVLVTNDSGPAHIAYALGTPTATIFGGGNPEANGPPLNARHRVLAYEVPCRPCGLATCPIGYRCLEGVTVQQAVEAATAVML